MPWYMCLMGASSDSEIAKYFFQGHIDLICNMLNFNMTVTDSYK